jgi:hypothetical protein
MNIEQRLAELEVHGCVKTKSSLKEGAGDL